MIDENDWARLARYLANECTPEEAEETRRWVEADPSRAKALAFMRDVNSAAGGSQPEWGTDASWLRIAARKSARERRPRLFPFSAPGAATPAWRRQALRVAAAIALVAAGSLLWLSRSRNAETSAVAVGVTREYVTPRGQRATFRLPDGSRVMLGVASKLRYAETTGGSAMRDLQLDGEALFQVKHDAARPFLVHTARAVTRDIGTRFGIRAYRSDTVTRVVVAEGSVELRGDRLPAAERGAVLTAGQLGQLGTSGDALVRSGVDVGRYLAWTEGRLVFDDTPLRDALGQLSRWYDLDFRLADSGLGGRRLTATMAGEDMSQTLDLLASSLGLRYERHGRTVTFYTPSTPTTHR